MISGLIDRLTRKTPTTSQFQEGDLVYADIPWFGGTGRVYGHVISGDAYHSHEESLKDWTNHGYDESDVRVGRAVYLESDDTYCIFPVSQLRKVKDVDAEIASLRETLERRTAYIRQRAEDEIDSAKIKTESTISFLSGQTQ